MKFISALVLTAILGFAVGIYGTLPWWSFVITSFIVAVAIHQRAGKAFLAGFLGMFSLWVILAMIKDTPNDHLLATKIAALLPLGGSYMALILVTGIVGGLVAGLAGLSGSYFRK